ncbi:phage adaptor protein [Burkholderia guangdongensis]|uniref:phage adaptor protein n=1 Tax=Burkholderia guangdongensis TaxID=1792500 RepID=UPI0015CBCDD9|nr:hypothetical protein [Burkholderia guangdongensis]
MSGLSFDSYDDLQATIAAYLQRTNLTAQIPVFIQLAEVKLRATIDTMEAQFTNDWLIQPAQGSNVVALPTDCASIANVIYGCKKLEYTSVENLSTDPQRYGRGEWSTLGNNLYLQTYVDGVKLLVVNYFRTIQPLSEANPSNWLLEDWPNVYLYAVLVEAAKYLMDDERLPMWSEELESAVLDMKESDKIARYPARSKLQMRVR